MISREQVTSWFVFDVLTIGLATFDILPTLPVRAELEVPDGTNNFTFFKVLRTLRLIKLMRLARAERVFSRWESKITLTYGTQTSRPNRIEIAVLEGLQGF